MREVRWWLVLICAVGIAYGSLYPFEYHAAGGGLDPWTALLHAPLAWTNFPDVVGNIVLFVPLGLCMRLIDQRMRPVAVGFWFVLFFAYAVVIQEAQYYFGERYADLGDALWNALGCAIGIAGAWLGRRFSLSVPNAAESATRTFAMLLLALWLGAELAPFVPTLDVQRFKDALRPLLTWDIEPLRVFTLACDIAVCAEILRTAFGAERLWRNLIALIAFSLFAKLVVVFHAWRWATFVALPLGALLARYSQRLSLDNRRLFLAGLLFTTYTASAILPLVLRSTPEPMSWIPFAARLNGDMLHNLDSLFLSMFRYTTILWLLVAQGARLRGLTILLASWAFAMEWAQTWLEGRTPDATETLLVVISALLVMRAYPQRGESNSRRLPLVQKP